MVVRAVKTQVYGSERAGVEATVKGIHGLQIVVSRRWEPAMGEKIEEAAEASVEFISKKGDELTPGGRESSSMLPFDEQGHGLYLLR
jgi:hypothetical protein